MAATGVVASSCGEEDEGNAADKAIAHLRECGLLTEGELDADSYTGGSEDDCFANCLVALECADAYAAFCTVAGSPTYTMCQANCTPKCADGVTPMEKCDGFAQCPDMSDELNCPMIACTDGTMAAGEKCDGVPQCTDMSDEAGCPPPPMYACANGLMVAGARCDGQVQCADMSDEAGCAMIDCTMPPAGSASGTPSAAPSGT